jgi:putative salt-induced outer membrane protein YdiY
MQYLGFAAALAVLATCSLAQDKIHLANGDVLTGTIVKMADGKITIDSPHLGEVKVPLDTVSNLTTQGQVELARKDGDPLKARITGIDGGNLRLEGQPALALNNLVSINVPKEAPKWTGSIKVSALWTDGNTDERSVGAYFDAVRRTEQDRTSLDASWEYGEDKQNDPAAPGYREWSLSQRRVGGGAKYDYFLGKESYVLGQVRALADTLADLDLRLTAGAGLGYTWVDNETTTFLTEVGPSYVSEDYRSGAPSQENWALRVSYKLTHAFSDKTKLVHGVEAYPSLEDEEDIYLTMKTELVTSLTESMVASIAHVLDYDATPSTSPAREFDKLDNRVMLSVGWKF